MPAGICGAGCGGRARGPPCRRFWHVCTGQAEPRGLALVIAPWNFPVLLSLGPVISVLAVGNRVVLKPSEATPETAKALATMLAEAFPPEEVAAVQGGWISRRHFLICRFIHIFFTGGTEIGRQVMAKAARTLASVTLELGGNMHHRAGGRHRQGGALGGVGGGCRTPGRPAWRPTMCSCRAPCSTDLPKKALRGEIARRYGSDTAAQKASRDFGRIVIILAFRVVRGASGGCARQGASVLAGEVDAAQRFIAPTVLTDISDGMAVSREEIFGPLLPLIAYDDLAEVLAQINAAPRPLALYIFSRTAPLLTG